MIHGVRRPSGPKVWSEPTAIQAFMKLSTMPSAMVRARPATRPSPDQLVDALRDEHDVKCGNRCGEQQ